MAERTSIEWTEATWNPLRGCSRVSPGCEHCYAEGIAARFSGPGLAYEGLAEMGPHGPRWTRKLRLLDAPSTPDGEDVDLLAPLRWRAPRRVFVNSMSDLFHEDVPFEFIAAVFAVMAGTRHTFQILTKRAARLREWHLWARARVGAGVHALALAGAAYLGGPTSHELVARTRRSAWPLRNVWQGVSVESEHYVVRIEELLDVPAAVRFVSYEPALGPVDFRPWTNPSAAGLCVGHHLRTGHDCAGGGGPDAWCEDRSCGASWTDGRGIDWLIVGGESGPRARDFDPRWAGAAIAATRGTRCAVFMKQMGSRVVSRGQRRPLRSPKGGDMSEWPPALRVRDYPRAEGAAQQETAP